ncbi:hypothetical protein PF006_g13924 [Phytophthora fragariae]|uniref:Uncharacterized protein n=1 Tax=Phytophthora fragariae TaxID=53985 RepID=A0A6A3TWW4_9STRA|nr:hypothetical protein PF011_g13224 [Phytophthora fragariae]KAE9138616.1 hypothetical protein PF006_g13924 [Phytophthora fragariae]
MAEMQMDAPDTGPPDPGIGQSGTQEITGISTSTPITGERLEQGTESPGAASGGGPNGRHPQDAALNSRTETDMEDGTNEGKAESQHMTWGDRVRNNNPDNEDTTEVMARKSHMLEGVWNPIQQAHLVRTLMADWDITEAETWTTDVVDMRQEAMANAQLLKVELEDPTANAAQAGQSISVRKDAQQDNAQHQIEPVGGEKAGDGFKISRSKTVQGRKSQSTEGETRGNSLRTAGNH